VADETSKIMAVTYSKNREKAEAETWRDEVVSDGSTRIIATHGNAPTDIYACAAFTLADYSQAEIKVHAQKSLVIATQAAARVNAGWLKQSERAARNRKNASLIDRLGGVEIAEKIAKLPAGEMQIAIDNALIAHAKAQKEGEVKNAT